jgi:hypothetical protein
VLRMERCISSKFTNCLAWGGSGYGFQYKGYFFHCTAVNCPTYGFQSRSRVCLSVLCLAAGCGTAGFNSGTYFWQGLLNCADDTSAPGGGSASGFLTSDFVDYAGNDFRLRDGVRFTTKARFYGHPITLLDAFGNLRKDGPYVYAGFHDPDPDIDRPIGMLNWRHP